MTVAAAGTPRPVYTDIGRALSTDYFLLKGDLTDAELDYLERTRRFVHEEVLPVINDYWERAEVPVDLCLRLGELGLVGDGLEGYGCPQMSRLAAGLIQMELSRGDGSVATFLGVHAGLAMRSIAMLGSEGQKKRWLPAMARCEKLGAFALTEPLHGSDSVSLETEARRDGDTYVINGAKRWIGNATFADVVVVWARDVETNKVLGFVVEKGTPGFTATKIENKFALRIVQNADIVLDECRVPEANRLQNAHSFKDAAEILRRTRSGVAWQAVGVQFAAYELALAYAKERTQFGRPIGKFQMVQDLLVKMLGNATACAGMMVRLAQLQHEGVYRDEQSALAKAYCTSRMRETVHWARELFGGNGIVLDYNIGRFVADSEALYSYEGTFQMQNLIVGKAVTGFSAFV